MQTTAIQVNLGMINLNETEVTKKLAGWAAIIAIPTLIAGIYGMNFKNIPEYDWQYGYFASLGFMVGADLLLYLWFKKIRWL
jgi:magnesium transporter